MSPAEVAGLGVVVGYCLGILSLLGCIAFCMGASKGERR